jgi:uncharacterized membrane protein YcaP (DUF421 family)
MLWSRRIRESRNSVTEGVILVATIVFWSYALDWLGYQFPKFEQLMSPPPLLLVDHGKLIRRNMRQELHALLGPTPPRDRMG